MTPNLGRLKWMVSWVLMVAGAALTLGAAVGAIPLAVWTLWPSIKGGPDAVYGIMIFVPGMLICALFAVFGLYLILTGRALAPLQQVVEA